MTRFSPLTNCMPTISGERKNIQSMGASALLELLVKFHAWEMSATDLKVLDKVKFDGFLLTDWVQDIKTKLEFLEAQDEKKNLAVLEKELNSLLSDSKQTELRLEEIENLIK